MSFAIRQDLLWCWGTSDSQSWRFPSSAISGSYQTVWTVVFLKPLTFSCNCRENCDLEFLPLLNAKAYDNMCSSHNKIYTPYPIILYYKAVGIFFTIGNIHNIRCMWLNHRNCYHVILLDFVGILFTCYYPIPSVTHKGQIKLDILKMVNSWWYMYKLYLKVDFRQIYHFSMPVDQNNRGQI